MNRYPGAMRSRVSAGAGAHHPVGLRGALQRADHGGPDRPDRGAARSGVAHRRRHLRGNLVAFRMHRVRGDVLLLHRPEGTGPDLEVQRDDLHAAPAELGQHGRGEVQSRRRRRHASLAVGIHRLVPILVLRRRVVVDVGRQRQPAELRDGFRRRHTHEADPPFAVRQHLERLDLRTGAEGDALARAERAAGLPDGEPDPSVDGWINSTSAGAPEGRVPSSRAWRTRVELSTSRSPAGMRSRGRANCRVFQPRGPAAPPDNEQRGCRPARCRGSAQSVPGGGGRRNQRCGAGGQPSKIVACPGGGVMPKRR